MKLKFIEMKTFAKISDVYLEQSLFFHGHDLDDRGEAALELSSSFSLDNIKLQFDEAKSLMYINDKPFNARIEFIKEIKTIIAEKAIIEATTLGFAEILLLLNALMENSRIKTIKILYIEPKEYTRKKNKLYNYHDFELTDKFENFKAVPGFTFEQKGPVEIVAFLGFERTRLGQLLQSTEIEFNKLTPIIPLPAFVLGWENRTINNHLYYFTPQYSFQKLYYAGANNPYQAYLLLNKFSIPKTPLRIAPIGTKPNAIGCAIFLVNNKESLAIDVIYDYPKKSSDRTYGVGDINLYTLDLDSTL